MIGVVIKKDDMYAFTCGGGVEIHTPDTIGQVIYKCMMTWDDRDGKGRHKKSVIYMSDLSTVGTAILHTLKGYGLADAFLGSTSSIYGEYSYMMDDAGAWYRIEVKNFLTHSVNYIYSLERVISCMDTNGMGLDLESCARRCYDIINRLKSTVGSECLTMSSFAYRLWSEQVSLYDRADLYPDARRIDVDLYGCTLDDCLRLAYKGGWCYMTADPSKVYKDGITLDCNSLYPYIMLSRRFPCGSPYWVIGKDLPAFWRERLLDGRCMAFVHFSCCWDVKTGHVPFLQIPGDVKHFGVSSHSAVWDADHVYSQDKPVDLWMTREEHDLFLEQYEVREYTFYEWIIFGTVDCFSQYVKKFYTMKSDARKRGDVIDAQIAKGMLNFLSGTFAKKAHRVNSYYIDDEYTTLNTYESESNQKSLIYIGACITSWARVMMVRLAQKNYNRFLYCDTDSLHLIGKEPPVGCDIDGSELGKFKVEREWRAARFYKQKCYIEQKTDGHYELIYAGVPHDVQDRIEKRLDGLYGIGKHFADGEPTWETKDGNPLLDGVSIETEYLLEVPNGTFAPDKVARKWVVDMTEAKERDKEQYRRTRQGNRTNKMRIASGLRKALKLLED